jgi:hypothetical protein
MPAKSYPHFYPQYRVAFRLASKELISVSDHRVQRVDNLTDRGSSGLLLSQFHAC